MNWKLPVPFVEEMLSKSVVESSEFDGVGREVEAAAVWTTGSGPERSPNELAEAI